MATVTFQGDPVEISGDLPSVGTQAPDFKLISGELSELSLSSFKGKKIILNILPSVDTPVCALQLKTFNEKASKIDNSVVLFASLDLPFAFSRFCGAEGIKNAVTASDYRHNSLAKNYGVEIKGGPLAGLYTRAVLVLDESHKVVYSELVQEITNEPNYNAAIAAI